MSVVTSDFNTVVNLLTNWQRNQWAKDGYPGLRNKDISKLAKYLYMKRRAV